MAKLTTTKELRRMKVSDLLGEVHDQKNTVAKLYLAVKLGGEKNSAKARNAKRQLARMLTILAEKEAEELLEKGSVSTVEAKEGPSTAKKKGKKSHVSTPAKS